MALRFVWLAWKRRLSVGQNLGFSLPDLFKETECRVLDAGHPPEADAVALMRHLEPLQDLEVVQRDGRERVGVANDALRRGLESLLDRHFEGGLVNSAVLGRHLGRGGLAVSDRP